MLERYDIQRRVVVYAAVFAPVFIFATAAYADTSSNRSTLIAQLLSQVAVLQQKIAALGGTPVSTSTTSSCAITRTLAFGAKGDDVRCLQQFLIAQNILADSATGYFGRLTQTAVKQFQQAHNLEPVGIVGPRTRAIVNAGIANGQGSGGTPNPPTPQPLPSPVYGGGGGGGGGNTQTCTPDSAQTQTLSCPAGQTGSITQTRASSCPAGATTPVWSDWQATSNTCVPPPPPPKNAIAQQWQIAEITLTSDTTYANPFSDIDVDATFTGPGGITINRPAFWDGGGTWKVRFAPPAVGAWTYATHASNAKDSGLNGRQGTVTAIPYDGSLSIYQHGFVKSQPGHYLVYADGTPFWWMGNDMTLVDDGIDWAIYNGGLEKSCNKTNWNPPVAHPNSQVFGSIDRWVNQKFNVIVFAFFEFWRPNTPGATIDVRRFQQYYDPVVAYAASQGMTIQLSLGSQSEMSEGLAANKARARYLVARYGAYPVVYGVAEPDTPVGVNGVQPSYASDWGTVLSYAASLDGYHHPIGPWYRQTALGEMPTLYLDQPWASLIIHQCGHLLAPGDYTMGGKQPIASYQFYYDHYPTIPMVEAGGCNYAAIFPDVTDYVSRRSAWRAALGGSSGFGFGENGMWQMQWDASGPNYGGEGQITPWYVGIDAASGAQMRYLGDFMTALPWQSMQPLNLNHSIITWTPSNLDDIATPVVRGDSGLKHVAAYLPTEFPAGGTGIISGLANKIYKAQWYNPASGAFASISPSITPGANGTWAIPARPDGNDWTLLLQSTGVPVTPGTVDHPPIGNFDYLNSQYAVGWSYDPDATSSSNTVAVYLDGTYGAGGTFIGYAPVNIWRSDVDAALGIAGNHGFTFQIPAQYASGSHTVYVYGMDDFPSGQTNKVLLSSNPKTFAPR